MMIVTKTDKKAEVAARITQYSVYNGTALARIEGSFKPLQLSKAKVRAILNNLEALKAFASGKIDKELDSLTDDQVIVPE